MLSDMFDRGNKQDWERFFKEFQANRFRENATNDELHILLSLMADYDRSKFDQYLFNFACEEIESRGINVCDDISVIYPLMRRRFLEVGLKLYAFYRENPYRVHIDVKGDENNGSEIEVHDESFSDVDLDGFYQPFHFIQRREFVPQLVR